MCVTSFASLTVKDDDCNAFRIDPIADSEKTNIAA